MAPVQKQVERRGGISAPYTRRYPEVRGGVCEFCGVIDKNVPSQYQYKLCEHFRGLDLMCSYCDATKNPDDVVYKSVLNIHDHPDRPNELVVVCDSFECADAHLKRFKVSK